MDARETLAATPLFADALDAEQLSSSPAQSRPAFFRADTRLMNQGDFGGSMFVIVEGKVAVSFTDEERARAAGGDARQRRGRRRDVAFHRGPPLGDGQRR